MLLVPQESVNVTLINQKQWTQEQVRHVPVFVFMTMEEDKHCKISQSSAFCCMFVCVCMLISGLVVGSLGGDAVRLCGQCQYGRRGVSDSEI